MNPAKGEFLRLKKHIKYKPLQKLVSIDFYFGINIMQNQSSQCFKCECRILFIFFFTFIVPSFKQLYRCLLMESTSFQAELLQNAIKLPCLGIEKETQSDQFFSSIWRKFLEKRDH